MLEIFKRKRNTNLYFKNNILWNYFVSIVSFLIFTFVQAQFPSDWKMAIIPFFIKLLITTVMQFTLYYATLSLFSRKMDKNFSKITMPDEISGLSTKERTKLFLNVSNFPSMILTLNYFYYIIESCIYLFVVIKILGIKIFAFSPFIIAVTFVYCAYVCSILNYIVVEGYYNKIAAGLLSQGIEKSLIERKKSFGIPLRIRCVLFIVVPLTLSTIFSFCVFYKGYQYYLSSGNIIFDREKMVITCLLNIIVILAFSIVYYSQYKDNVTKLQTSSIKFLGGKDSEAKTQISLNNRVQYNIYLLNEIIDKYSNIISTSEEIGLSIFESTNSLATISKQVANNSDNLNGEISSYQKSMEDASDFSKNISTLVTEVSDGTNLNKIDIQNAFEVLQRNINQMNEIKISNTKIIDGITKLSEQMKSIDEIAALINDIADQTKVVAYNAELEAISVEKEENHSDNFHIVSTEIKRLANSTADSIHEIQNYIASIQSASKALLEASTKSTVNIEEENDLIANLESQYNAIMTSSDELTEKANVIKSTVQEQTASFQQIVATLKQISTGINHFSQTATTIKDNISDINEVAKRLTEKSKNYDSETADTINTNFEAVNLEEI